jgi:hypothetical protein
VRRLLVMLCMATTTASAQSRTCDVKESEQRVREVIQSVMDLRSQQDDRFLSFYASDEYSFPGESWVFQQQERAAERTRETKSARQSGETWHMEIRDLHLKRCADVKIAYACSIKVAQRWQRNERSH